MGVCCSREVNYSNYRDKEIWRQRQMKEEERSVIKGDFGASIMLQGSSHFISMATQQGKKGINQDSMTVWEDFGGEKEAFFCGVFDGHGPNGHKVSRYAQNHLPSKLSTVHKLIRQAKGRSQSDVDAIYDDNDNYYLPDHNHHIPSNDHEFVDPIFRSWKSSFLRSFREVDRELSLDDSIDSYCSGATAVVVVKQGAHLMIGNIGDSRAVMCTRGERGEVTPMQLTVDLKPSLPHEAERVNRCNGRIFSLKEEPGILRIWLPDEDSPGLAMTRSFGDFCLKDCGLISIPQVFYHKLTHQDEFVVLATDGVWDVLTNFEVMKIVLTARKRSSAAKLLVTHAVRAWKSRFPSSRTDDIAVICFFFKPPTPAKPISESSQITGDSLTHLNSISQYTYKSVGTNNDDGLDFRSTHKTQVHDEGEGESLTGTTLNYPRYTKPRHRPIKSGAL